MSGRCAWCGNRVRNRYVTLIMPNGETRYLHGKCSLMPEPYKLLGLTDLPVKITKGPNGDIRDYT